MKSVFQSSLPKNSYAEHSTSRHILRADCRSSLHTFSGLRQGWFCVEQRTDAAASFTPLLDSGLSNKALCGKYELWTVHVVRDFHFAYVQCLVTQGIAGIA